MSLRNWFAIQHSLTRDGSEFAPRFDPAVYDEMRAQMRLDRGLVSPTRSAAAVKREADRHARERAKVLATASVLRSEIAR